MKLLDKYLKKIELKKERERLSLLKKSLRALKAISRDIPFEEAYIFGSILKKKKFYYDSDIDIAVRGLEDKDFFRFMASAADLMGRDVDVIQIERHHLQKKVLREGLLWKRPN